MPGTAARMAWNADERLMAMIWSHFSGGNSSIGDTCWMPALLTRMSTAPKAFSASRIMPAISSGFAMSAGEWMALTPNSASMPLRARSISPASPKPLRTTLAPSLAMARAMARPMPLVEPVTTADLERSIIENLLCSAPSRAAEAASHGTGRSAAEADHDALDRDDQRIATLLGLSMMSSECPLSASARLGVAGLSGKRATASSRS